MKINVFNLFAILVFLPLTSWAQTNINLAERCDCEVINSDSEIAEGATTPAGESKGNLLIDASGDVFYWDGSQWTGISAPKGGLPIGSMISYVSASVPSGWLACDGSAVSRTAYAGLFAIIGTTYGVGDGATTFNLPDTRGVFLRGSGSSGFGSYATTLGSFQGDAYKSHSHSVDPPNTISTTVGNHAHVVDPPNTATTTNGNHTHTTAGERVSNFGYPSMPGQLAYHGHSSTTTSAAGNHNHTVNIAAFNSSGAGAHNHFTNIPAFNSGASGSTETRPANIGVQYIIKY